MRYCFFMFLLYSAFMINPQTKVFTIFTTGAAQRLHHNGCITKIASYIFVHWQPQGLPTPSVLLRMLQGHKIGVGSVCLAGSTNMDRVKLSSP